MDVKELRIGNLLNKERVVVNIDARTIFDFDLDGGKYKPIPLTGEWLLKFGFEVYDFEHKENQYRFKERLLVIRDGIFCDYGTSVKLNHVHQLQNLYFALTGEELRIKA